MQLACRGDSPVFLTFVPPGLLVLCTFLTLLLLLLHLVSSGLREQEYLCHMLFKALPFFGPGMFQAVHGAICLQNFSPLCSALFLLGLLSCL